MALSTADQHSSPRISSRTKLLWLILGLPAALILVVVGAQIHGLDFTVYREGARAFLGMGEHRLYDPALVQTDTRGLPFTYPPFAALLLTPFAFLPEAAGLVLLTATSCLCLVLTAVLVARYLRDNDVLPERVRTALGGTAGVVVLATLLIGVLGPWREGLGFGQINPMLMVLIVADLIRPAGRIPRGILIGLAAGIKLTPLAFGLIFLVRRDWRAVITLGVTFAATVAAGWLASPEQSRTFWFSALSDPSRVGDTTDMYNVSLNSLLAHLGTPEFLQRPLWLLAAAAVVVLGFLAIRRADGRGDTLAAISANAVVMLAISPISWFHHWVWIALILPALWVSVRRRRRAAVRAWGTALVIAMLPVFMLSSITITMILTGEVSGQGPAVLEVFTGLGVVLPVLALVCWTTDAAGPSTRGSASGTLLRHEQLPERH